MSAEFDELVAMRDAAGARVRVTFDSRRYARAAREWPDYLPPMDTAANAVVERWGMNRYMQWEVRTPEAWPAPTVEIGEVWEARNASATWAQAEDPATSKVAGFIRVHVVKIVGECFISSRGTPWPMDTVRLPNWRRADAHRRRETS